jgi:hypothetical protein
MADNYDLVIKPGRGIRHYWQDILIDALCRKAEPYRCDLFCQLNSAIRKKSNRSLSGQTLERTDTSTVNEREQ